MILPEASGRIITFYSYKGGTGRSLALATTAWILASYGKSVLMLDWDLEAPGLHRYFKPFLIDKELSSSEGIIDFVANFADEVVGPLAADEVLSADWYVAHADLTPYVLSVDYAGFPAGGKIDFVPAGRQGPTYATKVNSFDWQNFYDRLGGGAFFEAAKTKMRESYEYILVDSRTGVSDTAGICTVQMPDVLTVCFTYNNQSIEGAAAVARSVEQERRKLKERRGADKAEGTGKETEKDTFVIFPVPTRVDQSEQDKLKLRQTYAREVFDGFLHHLDGAKSAYWLDVEVPYLPFLAYEEVLPVFTDDPRDPKKSLASMLRLTGYLTGLPLSENLLEIENGRKQEILREFAAIPGAAREGPRGASAAGTPPDEEKTVAREATLQENQELVRWRRELQPLLRAWSAAPEDRRTLLRDPALTAAKRWLRVAGPSLTESEKTYILECLADERKRRGERWRTVAVALAIVVLGFALFQLWSLVNFEREKAELMAKRGIQLLALKDTENGIQAIENRDYDTAIQAFTSAIDRYRHANGGVEGPESSAAYLGRAVVSVKKGDATAARRDLDLAIALKPSDPDAYVARGNLVRDQGSLPEAIADYDRALKLNPHDAEAYMNRGLAKANAQQIDAAITDYKQAVQEKPGLADAFLYLGLAYQKRGEKQNAVTALEKAADLAKGPAVAVPAQASLKELRGTAPPQPTTVTAAVPKVFLQYRDRTDAPVLDAVTDSLKGERFNVQGKELRNEATQGDIRYYHPSDRENAEAAKSSIEKALSAKGVPLKLQVLNLGSTYKSVAPGTIEVWLPSLSKPPAPPGEPRKDLPKRQ